MARRGNPGVWGTAGPLPRTGNPGVWGRAGKPTPAAKKGKAAPRTVRTATAPPMSSALSQGSSPRDPRAEIAALLAGIYEAQQKRINSAFDSRSNSLRSAYEALQGVGRGIAPAIQDVYSSASKDTAAFGKGFSDAVTQASGGQADAATAALAAQGGPQTVTSGFQTGGGDALYAVGGAIPASALAREGAGFAAAASHLPYTAAGMGVEALRGLEGERLDAILGMEGDRSKAEFDLFEKLLGGSGGSELKMVKLADGRIQWFDPMTGQPTGKPIGPPKRAGGATANLQARTLGDGRVQWFNPKTGKPVGPPQGPIRMKSSNFQARTLANGQIQWFDPSTGRAVGAPVGPPKKAAAAARSKGYNLQAKPIGDGRYQWFDPRSGKAVGTPFGQPKVNKDGLTPAKRQELREDAFLSARDGIRGWTDDEGNYHEPKKPREVLQDLMDAAIPFDIAVRAVARFFPPAKKWYKPRGGAASKAPFEKASLVAPASFRSTHPTDGLGWPAIDIMGKPGTSVGAPVSGTVVRHGSAQGGEALYLQGDNGSMYWLGHIEGMVPVGTRVRRGETVAHISADHPRPHLHLARQ